METCKQPYITEPVHIGEPVKVALEHTFRRLQGVYRKCEFNPVCFFGLELKTALYVSELNEKSDRVDHARKYFLRPASEPIEYSFNESRFDRQSILSLAQCMTGQNIKFRRSRKYTYPDEMARKIEFVHPQKIDYFLKQREKRPVRLGPEGLIWAFQRYVDFTTAHPFDDGNGRVARVLLNKDIRSINTKEAFITLPIGAISTIYYEELKGGFESIREKQCFDDLFMTFSKVLEAALDALEFFLLQKRVGLFNDDP